MEDRLFEQATRDTILLLIGARQTGKTTLLRKIQRQMKANGFQVDSFTLEDPQLLAHLNQHPENLFRYISKPQTGTRFLLLDEIQYLDDPSNFLKYTYDLYHENLRIVATGSSAFYIDRKFKDSLAGRKRLVNVHPFSFSEFLRAKGEIGLSADIEVGNYFETGQKRQIPIPQKRELESYWQEYTTYGGYPNVVMESDVEEKHRYLSELHQSLLRKDIGESGIRQEAKFYMLLRLLAAQCGDLTNLNELANTIGLSHTAIANYMYVLEKSCIVKPCPSFHRNLRKELTKMPKVYFLDPGYRNSVLKSFARLEERVDNGGTLETILFTEMVKNGKQDIRFWRTQSKQEIDFIVDDTQAFEVKMQARKFSVHKYRAFLEAYPEISLSPVVLSDDSALDMLDFAS
jgi:predicted AAA+ superfamily ATPase